MKPLVILRWALIVTAFSLIAAACGPSITSETATLNTAVSASLSDADRQQARRPSLLVRSPADGSRVTSPVTIITETKNFSLAPKGAVRVGEGHLHVNVDVGCVESGEVIVDDAQHVHYGSGGDILEIELPPGEHRLCIQAGDGFHVALGISAEMVLTVVDG